MGAAGEAKEEGSDASATPVPSPEVALRPDAVAPARAEIEALRGRAQEEGWRAGYREGFESGRDLVLEQAQRLEALFASLEQPLQRRDGRIEEELLLLSSEIARQLVRRELRTAPGEIVAVIREAVQLLPVLEQDVEIYVHPEDAAFLRQTLDLGDEHSRWKLREDPAITRGGARICSGMSSVDATVERRLATIVALAFGDERSSPGDEPGD